jgi:ketosteroid isomerase-like protein
MSIDDNVKLVNDVMDEFMRTGSPAALLAAISEDAEIKAVIADGTPISGSFRGREGFLRYLEALNEVMEILEVRTTDTAASERTVVLLGIEKARVRRTGRIAEWDTATVFYLEQGKITKVVAFAEMSAITDAYRVSAAR